ncbi:permease-like cell division protein FtsX [Amycolatopsis sp. cg13]|uniref:permease-like cell division protein FtsX n=1 Tax=Amycolatopsis sp. cg13 TaxID=3238807 RepID=UPI003524211F
MNTRDSGGENEPGKPEAPPSALLSHRSRPARWYRLAMAAVVLAAVAVLGGSGWWLFGGRYLGGYALPDGAIPIGDRDVCANTVTVMLGTDAEMAAVAWALRGDPRVLRSYTETQQDGYARFRKMFANEPELLELTSADTMPSLVTVVPMDQTGIEVLAEQFRVQFPKARRVSESTEFVSRIAGPNYRDPTCPPSGERSR